MNMKNVQMSHFSNETELSPDDLKLTDQVLISNSSENSLSWVLTTTDLRQVKYDDSTIDNNTN